MRLPAEWEEQGGVLISWPHHDTDWRYMLEDVTDCFVKIANAISRHSKVIIIAPDTEIPRKLLSGIPKGRIMYLSVPTNDTWARDFGAITTIDGNGNYILNDFMFNGWGLKFAAQHDNLITKRMTESGILTGKYLNRLDFVLEGGSIESDGNGLLLTTSECLLSPNRNGNLDKDRIEYYLKECFGLKKILWLDNGRLEGDDTDSHIDTLARLVSGDTIVYVGCNDTEDIHYHPLRMMKEQLRSFTNIDGRPFNLIELPLPDPIYDEDGNRLPATYANFLILNDAVLLPVYGQKQKDDQAAGIMNTVFDCREIIPIDCNALIKQHGSLHCVTMQFPRQVLPI